MDKKTLAWSIVAVAAILATLFFGVNYPIPPAPEPGLGSLDGIVETLEDGSRSLSRPIQLRDVRILQDLAVGGDAAVTGDVSVGDDLTVTDDFAAGGDVTITGGLEVTGGVTGTNVLTTGDQTVAGVKTFTSAVTGTGGAAITGAAINLNAASNFATNINTGSSNAALTLGGGSGTVAVNSSDWDISTAGVMTGIGAITADGVVAANAGITVDGTAFTVADTSGDVVTTGTMKVGSTSDLVGNIADSGGVLTIADNALIDGQADAIQLTVQGHSTQNTSLLVLETSDGTDVLTASNAGNVDAAGTLQYGANNLYPVGFATSGQQLVYGTAAVTGTLVLPHGLTTVTFCSAVLGQDPKTGGGEAAFVTVAVSANACTAKVWQDDWTTASVETDVVVQWLVIGAP